jgi:hypothetical protein
MPVYLSSQAFVSHPFVQFSGFVLVAVILFTLLVRDLRKGQK